jgi:hypothetical protein
MKKLYTSYYAKSGGNPNAISISAKAPPFFKGERYGKLAPTWDLLNAYKSGQVDERGYTEWYMRLLAERKLTPQQVVDELKDGTIMLCYEKSSDFCHRHIVAAWLQSGADVVVEELQFESKTKPQPKSSVDEFFEF